MNVLAHALKFKQNSTREWTQIPAHTRAHKQSLTETHTRMHP